MLIKVDAFQMWQNEESNYPYLLLLVLATINPIPNFIDLCMYRLLKQAIYLIDFVCVYVFGCTCADLRITQGSQLSST